MKKHPVQHYTKTVQLNSKVKPALYNPTLQYYTALPYFTPLLPGVYVGFTALEVVVEVVPEQVDQVYRVVPRVRLHRLQGCSEGIWGCFEDILWIFWGVLWGVLGIGEGILRVFCAGGMLEFAEVEYAVLTLVCLGKRTKVM